MIASLTGSILELTTSQCVIDVHGIGYVVAITPQTSRELGVGVKATLLTSMIVREDALSLFGFSTAAHRELFDLLRSVSGVGPKLALAVLAELDPYDIANAVANEDDKAFSRVSGIGPKTAKLLVVALTGRMKAHGGSAKATDKTAKNAARESVLQALLGLGIQTADAESAIEQVLSTNPAATRDVLLKETLSAIGAARAKR